jgi:hypothetical protein
VAARPAWGICKIVPICNSRFKPISSPFKSRGAAMIAASAIPLASRSGDRSSL